MKSTAWIRRAGSSDHRDDLQYPQEDSNLGIRLAVNFLIYDLTH